LSNLHAEIRIIQTKVQGLMRNAGMRPKLLVLAWLACGYALASAAAQPELASGRLVIGAEDDAAPWSYADGTGYVNDVVRAAFQRSGWQVQYMVMPYARCKAMVLSGKLIACFSASKTPDLASQLLYPRQPVFNASNVLIARANTDLQGCNPAEWPRPVKVGRVASYEYRANVMALFGSPQVQVDDNNSEVSNIRKLEAGHIDAALVTLDAVKRLAASGPCVILGPKARTLFSADNTRAHAMRYRPSSPGTRDCSGKAPSPRCNIGGKGIPWISSKPNLIETLS
jgi:ABC-type amino acid transport substrate-binding protein